MDHLYFVVHTHWDREWYEPFQRMRARLVAMTDRMLTLVEEGKIPCFHFDGQTIVLEDYLEVRPQNADESPSSSRTAGFRSDRGTCSPTAFWSAASR